MPIFIKLTWFTTDDLIMVNSSKIQTISSMREQKGSTITFEGGRKIAVKETPEELFEIVKQFMCEI